LLKKGDLSTSQVRQKGLTTGILMGLFDFLESTFLSSLYILNISILSDLGEVKILSQSVGAKKFTDLIDDKKWEFTLRIL
jgi:hypothetical protein